MSAPGVRTRRAATAATAGPRVARLTLGRVLRRPEEDDMAPFREARRALEARASALGCVHQLERGEEHKLDCGERIDKLDKETINHIQKGVRLAMQHV